jgi:nucleoside-diphosphate-sugar epimerase
MNSNPSNKVLVTGGSGFIGYHCLAPLVARGYQVFAVYAKRRPEPISGVTWVRADLLDPAQQQALLAQVKPGRLLHLAWYVEPGKLVSHPDNLRWVSASLELIRLFHELGGARCVVTGTGYEYDRRYGYCSEALTPRNPNTLYGAAKHGLHEVFSGYCTAAGLSGAWGRVIFLYGPREDPRRFVASIVKSLLSGDVAPTSSGEHVGDFLHVQDVADGLVALLDSDLAGDFNICSGRAVAFRTIVERIGALTGRADLLRIGAIASRPNDAQFIVGDNSRLKREAGWSPAFDLDSGLLATIDWWRGHLAQGTRQ